MVLSLEPTGGEDWSVLDTLENTGERRRIVTVDGAQYFFTSTVSPQGNICSFAITSIIGAIGAFGSLYKDGDVWKVMDLENQGELPYSIPEFLAKMEFVQSPSN